MSNKIYLVSEERLADKIHTFARFGDDFCGGITRYALSKEDELARDEFVRRMQNIGCEIYSDDLANLYAVKKGRGKSKKKIVMASHLDSVKNGGNYDGVLGVICALEVLETLHAQNIPHRHDLVAMVWTNEEGSLYPPAMMSSAIISYPYLPLKFRESYKEEDLLKSKSILDNQTTFIEELKKFKYYGQRKNRINKEDYLAMFELHIEQGPILEANKKEIGVVDKVIGMCNYRIKIKGESDHAGTTPMSFRKDALFAASKVLIYLHQKLDELDKDLVYTTGEIVCHPNVHTVIPDYVEFSLDARHQDDCVIDQVKEIINSLPKMFEKCEVSTSLAWHRDTVYFNKTLINYVLEATKKLNYPYQYINSGAGHDAQMISYMLPTTMIFVPSKDGHSHCDEEFTSIKQCYQGANVLLNALLKCDEDFE